MFITEPPELNASEYNFYNFILAVVFMELWIPKTSVSVP